MNIIITQKRTQERLVLAVREWTDVVHAMSCHAKTERIFFFSLNIAALTMTTLENSLKWNMEWCVIVIAVFCEVSTTTPGFQLQVKYYATFKFKYKFKCNIFFFFAFSWNKNERFLLTAVSLSFHSIPKDCCRVCRVKRITVWDYRLKKI